MNIAFPSIQRAGILASRLAVRNLAGDDFKGEALRAQHMLDLYAKFASEIMESNAAKLANAPALLVVRQLSRIVRRMILETELGSRRRKGASS